MNADRLFRLGKCWQGTSPQIVWQINLSSELKSKYQGKIYLVIECEQARRGFKLLREKPANLKPGGSIVALLRKYLPQIWVGQIAKDRETGDLWLIASAGQEEKSYWYLRLSRDKPPELSLILPDRTQLFRYGQKGTFTKKKSFEGELPELHSSDEGFENVFEELLSTLPEPALMGDSDPDEESLTGEISDQEEPDIGFSEEQRKARQKLSRRFKTVKKSYEKQKALLPTLSEVEQLQAKGTVLQSWAFMVKKDQVFLKIDASMSGLPYDLDIDIDPEKSVGQNIETYFKEHKRQKKSLETGSKRLGVLQKQLARMEGDLEVIRSVHLSDSRVAQILTDHGLEPASAKTGVVKNSSQKSGEARPYRVYEGKRGELYYVGKGPRENDELTRGAKSNDFWVHVIGVTGSHVIIPWKSLSSGKLSIDAKKEAAILALHYSKIRTDQAGEVYVTQRRHLRKQKGLPAGLWLVDQSETYFLKYSSEDLKGILDRLNGV